MRRRAVLLAFLFFVGAGALLAGHFGLNPLSLEPSAKTETAAPADPPQSAEATDPLRGIIPTPSGRLTESGVTVDIARVSPDGASVFAGRSDPETYVTVFDDGKPIGSAKADSGGEWSLATEHKFASLDPKLTYGMSTEPPAASNDASARSDGAAEALPGATASASDDAKKRAAAAAAAGPEAVTKELLRKFEGIVAEAREEAKREKEQAGTTASAPATTTAEAPPVPETSAPVGMATESNATPPPAAVQPPAAQPEPPAAQASAEVPETSSPVPATAPPTASPSTAASAPAAPPAAEPPAPRVAATDGTPKPAPDGTTATAENAAGTSAPIPVPIMFVYNEAIFTDDGRRAADLLLEYLNLKRAAAVTLSGHADERGSDDYNLDLSRERLAAVERYLHAGGFTGNLNLLPKGKSEPFMGVDRSKYPREALFQLDRRVELRLLR